MTPHIPGSVEVICGSMFSGKTDELIRRLRRATIARQHVQVFKPAIDIRYAVEKVSSHAGSDFAAIPIEKAAEIFEQLYAQKPSQYYFQYLIFCFVETKDYNKAERIVKKSMKAEPEALRYQVDLGYVYFRSGNQEKAKK